MSGDGMERHPTSLSVSDLYIATYLALSLPVFFMVPADTPGRIGNAVLHAGVLAAILLARRLGLGRSRIGGWILDLYPVPLFAFLYLSISVLNRVLVPDGYLDAPIISFEAWVFGGQPAQTLREALPWGPLSEYLHLAYFLYYAYFPLLLIVLLATRRREALRSTVATVSLSYILGFVIFCLVPVSGPYWNFPRMDPGEHGYVMPHVVQWMLNRGSALGTAFPSSHVSISVTVWILAMRYSRRTAVVLAFFVPAMAVGTVYGGFHYVTDMVAGAVLGILAGTAGHRVTVGLMRRRGAGRSSLAGAVAGRRAAGTGPG